MSSKKTRILRSIKVTLPWPPPEVFPNARNGAHWTAAWPKLKVQKQTAWGLAREQIGRQNVPRDRVSRWGLQYDFYPPDARRRDEDGMIGAMKAAQDGIAQALGIDDSLFRITHTVHPPRRPHGAVVATVTAPEVESYG